MTFEYAPGPALRVANNDSGMSITTDLLDDLKVQREMTLQERLRKYSATSGYARYTSMAADRIDELTAVGVAQQATISRLKAILEERNYKVLTLTTENEHHKVNEKQLQELIIAQRQDTHKLEDRYDQLYHRCRSAEGQLEAARERGLFATILHYFRSK